jgi:hypothetical protein
MVKHEPELHITVRRHRCCTLLLHVGLSQVARVAKVPLTRVEPRGLEPLTPCLQSIGSLSVTVRWYAEILTDKASGQ